MKVAGAMLAVTILGFEGAVAGDVLWGIAFPTESRGGECDDCRVVWASLAARGREERKGRCPEDEEG